ncbi:dosage compensation regulator isoform X2 [Folsomia candida]|nr:dosage compensation regulator isoform X2 [Folsomia candida]
MEETSSENPKSFLYAWLGARKVTPDYNIRGAPGNKARPRFICELRVDGFNYTGVGNSISKKDASTNAARDFIEYLIRTAQINPSEVPEHALSFVPSAPAPQIFQPGVSEARDKSTMRPVFSDGQGPSEFGKAYRRYDGQIPFQMMNAKNVADAEELDFNAAIHGNWTLENAKGRLHQFLQTNRIHNMDYVYSTVGPDHQRSFRADMEFYVRELGRKLRASETGSNKQTASKSCALSLVRQLYHLGVIEAYSGLTKKTKESETMKSFEASIDPALMQNVHSILGELGVIPKQVDLNQTSSQDAEGNPVGISLLADSSKPDVKYDVSDAGKHQGVVSWSPPLPNWNPWTNSNIDLGHLATTNLEQLSSEFLESFRLQQQTNEHVQKMLEVRNSLPVYKYRSMIMDAISENQVILIKGETGSGKTTQICQYILDDYLLSEQGAYCSVVCTQPRRISAISVSERVASERGEDLGESTGYSVRFESCLPRPYASILFCTVGVLLRKLEGGLRGVSHVIVDEIHERDVNSDFILIVLRDMLSIYPDLRVILMSATIDTNLFTEYFNSCPVLEIEGRTFPVQTFYLEDIVEKLQFKPSMDSIRRAKKKKQEEGEDELLKSEGNMNILPPGSGYSVNTERSMAQISEQFVNPELLVALLEHIRSLEARGSILIFLDGWNSIFGVLKYLQEHPIFGSGSSYLLLPLHSQLPREDQHRVFQPAGHLTKIILATNIAETSITIDDVVFVVDSCKAKLKLFTSHNNLMSFATVWASKSNLMQRRGRAGRVQPGYCFCLCSKARYESLDANMTPEMLRTPLHEIALAIKLLRLGGIGHFLSKAPAPPSIDTVIEAQVLLTELNCLDSNSELTPLGKILAKLPISPTLGKMLILGTMFNCADPLAIISAQSSNLSEVFTLGPENKRLTPTQRAFACHKHSDHLATLNAFQQWEYHKEKGGERQELEFCAQRMLSQPSLRVTSDAKNQLLQVLVQCGFPEEQVLPCQIKFREQAPVLDIIRALLCSGLYPNVCYHKEKRKVLTTESKPALVHKASVNCSRFEIVFPYPFFIFGEKIRTRAISCKQMTMVSPNHLLLFGSRKVEFIHGMVRLDNWINLKMNPNDASAIVALRPEIEKLVGKLAENPDAYFPLPDLDQRLINLVTELSRMNQDIEGGEGEGYQRTNIAGPAWRGDEMNDSFDSAASQDEIGNANRGLKRGLEEEAGVGDSFIPLKRPNNNGDSPNTVQGQQTYSNPRFAGATSALPYPRAPPPRFGGGQQRFPQYRGNNFPQGRGAHEFGSGQRFGYRNASPHRGWSPRGYGGGRRPGRFNRGFQHRGNS